MSLVDIAFEPSLDPIPDQVARLIADALQRVTILDDERPAGIPGFVPSDFELVYRALAEINAAVLASGHRFIEWGSGVGVVTCMAEILGFDAVGIEIDPKLVEIAESLAEAHGIETQFACGSFIPPGVQLRLDEAADVQWLTTDSPAVYDDLQLEPDDFDLVYAYPWPGEEQVIFDLFADYAARGALLLTYHGQEGLRLQRKVRT